MPTILIGNYILKDGFLIGDTMEEKFVWVLIANRTLEVYDNFDVALERYNQLTDKGVDVLIRKRPVRSEISGFATMD